RGDEQRREEQEAATLAVPPTQPAVPGEEHALELQVRARRPPTLRPPPIPTRIACHSSDIVLETAARQTGSPQAFAPRRRGHLLRRERVPPLLVIHVPPRPLSLHGFRH